MAQGRGEGPHVALGGWLRELRIAAGFDSQPRAEMRAQHLGLASITQGKLSYAERGWNPMPDPRLLLDLATLYGVPYEDLVARCVEAQYGLAMRPAQPGKARPETSVQPELTDEDRMLVDFRRLATKLGRTTQFMKLVEATAEALLDAATSVPKDADRAAAGATGTDPTPRARSIRKGKTTRR